MVLPLIVVGEEVLAGSAAAGGAAEGAAAGRLGAGTAGRVAGRRSGKKITERAAEAVESSRGRNVRNAQEQIQRIRDVRARKAAAEPEEQVAQKTPTMPSSRMKMMIAVAIIFDFLQIMSAALFMSPSISVALINAVGGVAVCKTVLNLGNAVCGVIGSFAGVFSGTVVTAIDAVSAGSVSAFSNTIGQLVSEFISITAIMLFVVWFMLSGVRFFGGKYATRRFGGFMVQSITELIPFVGTLPLLSFSVAYICLQAKKEDAENGAVQ